MKKLLKTLAVILIFLAVFFFTPAGAYAISYFNDTIAGMGKMVYTNEVTIVDWKPKEPEIEIVLVSTVDTQPDHTYTVYVYLNDSLEPEPINGIVSWALVDIPDKKLRVSIDIGVADLTNIPVEIKVRP